MSVPINSRPTHAEASPRRGRDWLGQAGRLFYRERYATYENHDGLGNRLRLHAVAHAYALRTGRKLVVGWRRNTACHAAFDDLFLPAFANFSSLPRLESWLLRRALWHPTHADAHHFDTTAFPPGSRVDDVPAVPQRVVNFPRDFDHAVQGVSHLAAYRETIVRGLTPRPELQRRFEQFWADRRRPALGLHLRLGDFPTERVPMERAIEITRSVLARLPGATLVLVSDGMEAELAPLLAAHPFVTRPKINARTSVDGMRDTLIDLLVLGACDVIIGTPTSSFGYFAAFYGDRPFVPASADGWQPPLARSLNVLESQARRLRFGDDFS